MCDSASSWGSFRLVSGCYGSKMGARRDPTAGWIGNSRPTDYESWAGATPAGPGEAKQAIWRAFDVTPMPGWSAMDQLRLAPGWHQGSSTQAPRGAEAEADITALPPPRAPLPLPSRPHRRTPDPRRSRRHGGEVTSRPSTRAPPPRVPPPSALQNPPPHAGSPPEPQARLPSTQRVRVRQLVRDR
jgi:hypothetical protein